MKLQTTMPLLFLFILSGCNLQDLGLEEKKSNPVLVTPTVDRTLALFSSFMLLQDQEMILKNLATQAMGVDTVSSVAGQETTTPFTGGCGGSATLVADLTLASGGYDNNLTLTNFCNYSIKDEDGWAGKLTQSGVLNLTGTDSGNYDLDISRYVYSVEADDAFNVNLVAGVKVVTGTAVTTQYFDSITLYKAPDNMTVQATGWLVATETTGKSYTGTLVDATYGKVALTTLPSALINSTQDGPYQIPSSGKLKFTGSGFVGYVTFSGLGAGYTVEEDVDADGVIDAIETMSW